MKGYKKSWDQICFSTIKLIKGYLGKQQIQRMQTLEIYGRLQVSFRYQFNSTTISL